MDWMMMKKKPSAPDPVTEFKALKRNSIKCQRDLKRDRVGLERQEKSLVRISLCFIKSLDRLFESKI
jgi:hypothetical protein